MNIRIGQGLDVHAFGPGDHVILGDGQVVLMLDVAELMEARSRDTAADLETLI